MHNKIKKDLDLCLNISNLSETTQSRYKYCILKFLFFVEEIKKEIEIQTVREFLYSLKEERNLSIGTVNDYRSATKYLFEVVIDEKWNDRKIPRLKDYKPIPVCLSINELKKLLENTHDILYKTIFSTIYSSGLRISEVVNIRFSDIDPERNIIHIRKSKSGRARNAILSDKNLIMLRKYYKKYWRKNHGKYGKEDYIFCTYTRNKPITTKSIRTNLKISTERSKINKELTPHSLRHSYAVHMLEAGASLLDVKNALGHKSILSTCIYLQLADPKKLWHKSPFDINF
jgi:integrase/recombinase XerD